VRVLLFIPFKKDIPEDVFFGAPEGRPAIF
jgi:hypothetical protein